MSLLYSRRRRSQSFGSFGSFKEQLAMEKPVAAKPELIEGYAHICFDEQELWFRGILSTADGQSSYNLTGKRTCRGMTEENDDVTDGPDVVRDFPSPLRTPNSGSVEIRSQDVSAASGCVSRQDSMDSRAERELQFILEELPMSQKQQDNSPPVLDSCCGSQPVSRPGSPPSTQQIVRALDNLLISSPTVCSISSYNLDNTSPFRSRSGSRSHQPTETVSVVFDVTISDLEEGSQHSIRSVSGRKGNSLTLRNKQLCFVTERSFWGQRADMIIQKQLAAPDMVGQGYHVFAGPMRFYFYNGFTSSGASSLTNWCW
ncbi:hypothetical protein GHT06_022134 [Daphnia sinensis]|uniref:Uncharacterized protein n=1 Tax=Daphnia sinensis TaxID=1820382 RepID=A0AAD5KXK1_9CRUS|nr:hypothetical protein GHT06_022134 [Daphnia sinensis]